MADKEMSWEEALERNARRERGKAEWEAVKAARAAGLPEPETPALDAMALRLPVLTSSRTPESVAESRSAAAHKAWETRRRNKEAAM